MGLFRIFHSKIDDWKAIDRQTKKSLEEFRDYLDRFLLKISLFQEIYVKIIDFDNDHIFERTDAKYLHKGFGNSNPPKLYEHYFYYIKRRLKKMETAILREFESETGEEEKLRIIHSKLANLAADDKEIIKYVGDIAVFERKLRNLDSLLQHQLSLVQQTKKQFKRFVGNEDRWERDYLSANAGRERFYSDVINKKNEIFQDWQDFLVNLRLLKDSIKEEIIILTGSYPGTDIAIWKVFVSNRFKDELLLADLDNILKKTRHIVIMSKKRISIYHATENNVVLPLLESRNPNGFYFCTNNKKYATKIKMDQLGNLGGHALNTFTISIPNAVLGELAIHDGNHGNPKDKLSEDAYDCAYYIPVSKYLVFNHYMNEGLIFLKE